MHLSGNLVSFLTVEFSNRSVIIDEVTTRNTTAYFFHPLCVLDCNSVKSLPISAILHCHKNKCRK